MASSSSSSSRYGGIRPLVAGKKIHHAMKLLNQDELQFFDNITVHNDHHIHVPSFRGKTDCQYALEICERQRLNYMINPGPETNIPSRLLYDFYTTLRMSRQVGPWIDDPDEWNNFRNFTFSVKIGRRRFNFTVDHVTAAYKNISVDEAAAESEHYAQMPEDISYFAEVFPHYNVQRENGKAYRRVHLEAHMWLLDYFIFYNLHPMGHERERTEFYSIILWWLSKGMMIDVGSIVLKLMMFEREKGISTEGNIKYYYPRLILSLMRQLGWKPSSEESTPLPLPIELFKYSNFTRSYTENKRTLKRWERNEEAREQMEVEQPNDPIDRDVEFRRQVLEYIEESNSRGTRFEAELRIMREEQAQLRAEQRELREEQMQMRNEQQELIRQMQTMNAQFAAWSTHHPPNQPPPP